MKGPICSFEHDGEKEWCIVKKKVTIHRTPAKKFPRHGHLTDLLETVIMEDVVIVECH